MGSIEPPFWLFRQTRSDVSTEDDEPELIVPYIIPGIRLQPACYDDHCVSRFFPPLYFYPMECPDWLKTQLGPARTVEVFENYNEFLVLKDKWERRLSKDGISLNLVPDAVFRPLILAGQEPPQHDFLKLLSPWGSSLVVRKKVVDHLRRQGIADLVCHPVVWVQHTAGEDEDYDDLLRDVVSQYHRERCGRGTMPEGPEWVLLQPARVCFHSYGRENFRQCTRCGRIVADVTWSRQDESRFKGIHRSRRMLPPHEVAAANLFSTPVFPTGYVVSPHVKDVLETLCLTEFEFIPLRVGLCEDALPKGS